MHVKGSAACPQAGERFCLCVVTDAFACLPFFWGLHFNLFLIAYLTHLAIKVKWLFDKCESILISADCFC